MYPFDSKNGVIAEFDLALRQKVVKGVKFTKSKGEFKNNENSICLLYISVGRSVAASFIAAMVFTGCATKGTHDEVAEKFREFQEAVAQRPAAYAAAGQTDQLAERKIPF